MFGEKILSLRNIQEMEHRKEYTKQKLQSWMITMGRAMDETMKTDN